MIRRTPYRLKLCIALLCLNLAVIWGNSLLPGSVSGAISQWVRDLIAAIFGQEGTDPDQGHGLLRKLAHFTEFSCLGLCLSWLFRMLRENPREHVAWPLLGGFLAACADETIQCFVPDRGPGILDVGIDTLGVAVGITIFSVVLTAQARKYNKREYDNEKIACCAADSDNAGCHDSLRKEE